MTRTDSSSLNETDDYGGNVSSCAFLHVLCLQALTNRRYEAAKFPPPREGLEAIGYLTSIRRRGTCRVTVWDVTGSSCFSQVLGDGGQDASARPQVLQQTFA